MKKLLATALFLSVLTNSAFAISLDQDYFIVYNLSKGNITMIFETVVEPTLLGDAEWYFYTEIDGVPVNVSFEKSKRKTIAPNEKAICIYYSPHGSWLTRFENDYYSKLRTIPMLNKLKAIFKSYIITDSQGSVLITLDDIKEEDIVIEENGNMYAVLSIYEKN
jgi:hypothetical protein